MIFDKCSNGNYTICIDSEVCVNLCVGEFRLIWNSLRWSFYLKNLGGYFYMGSILIYAINEEELFVEDLSNEYIEIYSVEEFRKEVKDILDSHE